MRVLAGLVLAGFVSACGGLPASNPDQGKAAKTGGFLSGLMAPKTSESEAKPAKTQLPLARARLVGGDVIVAGPEGYCLDPVTIENKRDRGFALIASCHILSDGKVGQAVEPVLITVTVGPKGGASDLPTPRELAFTAKAPLLGGETGDGFVVANLDSGGDALLEGGDQRHWRGAFLQGDRLVGLALYAPKGSPYAGAHGGGMLRKLHNKVAWLSPSGAAKPTKRKKTQQNALLDRLFGR